MSNHAQHNTFIFNEEIDKDLLISLYEDDFLYMEEIFSITIAQLKPDIIQLNSAFESGNLPGVKQAVHKIKPSFGFVGLPTMQEQCKQLEDMCGVASSVDQIATAYLTLYARLHECVIIIESEYRKFKEFNQS